MIFGAVGDLHGDFDALDRIMARHPEVAFWVCPGDLAAEDGDVSAAARAALLDQGQQRRLRFRRRAARRRRYASEPSLHSKRDFRASARVRARGAGRDARARRGSRDATRRTRAARESPPRQDDKRRHFVHEEVDACKALQSVDIFLSHEAARPFPLPRVRDAGKTPINEVLSAMHPRLHLFGHHHVYSVAERQRVPSISLDRVSESYLLFDGKTLAHQRLTI